MQDCSEWLIPVKSAKLFHLTLCCRRWGQGSLCIEIRKDDTRIQKIVSDIDDQQTRIAVEAERSLLAKLQGGCQVPIGAYAEIQGKEVSIEAIICTLDGDHAIRDRHSGP